ncbi:MerR family transcriptional regulator [Chondromyces apiculatus]|uniref:Transcriptional regulator, MerR family n=1 Tax=Chondromyces apiculatus DSM 436 TaxID=1192034 RepID=A0A017T3F9_9BACT|nr:B12-binding domain-containing protein [Chondromyces apiculatus]EYF03783.1 Transcriptional regulator, MerR family [Chondromyces apiculatus DSM 436]
MSRYRIQAVSKMSGVSTATLRAWERRYGVPAPARTASAYRLYSDDDVQLVKKMRDHVASGMAAAEAAQAVLEARGATLPATNGDGDAFTSTRDRIVEATVRFDPEMLEAEVSKALSLGPSVTIFERALGPALEQIGDLWHAGQVTVAQEHMASQILGATLLHLLRLAQPAESARRVVLAGFIEEDHVLGLIGVGLRFCAWGFRVVLLGPRTPPSAMARAVESLSPEVVALTVSVAPIPSHARDLVDAYADACRGTVWIVGGHGATALRPFIESRGGIVATDLNDLRTTIERALATLRRDRNGSLS